MAQETPPFDPNALAEWLIEGFKDTITYRARQVKTSLLDREQWLTYFKSKIPNKNQLIHFTLRRALEQAGFQFQEIKQGDATFHLIKKVVRETVSTETRRLVLVPGFGDSPASWLPMFTMASPELYKQFDEILLLDFPGYMGFLEHHEMVTSMEMLLSVVKLVIEANPPTVLMGHSLGGWLAAKANQDLQKMVDHLILIAPSGLIPEIDRAPFKDFFKVNQGMTIEQFLELVVHTPKKFQAILKNEVKGFYSREEVLQFVDSVTEKHFVEPSEPFAAKKLTVIWGDTDRFVPTSWLRHWIEHFGEVIDAYVVENSGHVPQYEHPIVLSRILLHAITGQKSKSGSGWKKLQSRKREMKSSELKGGASAQKNTSRLIG